MERRVQSLGESQAAALASYQAVRGDARFDINPTTGAFEEGGQWVLLSGNGSWRSDHFLKTKAIAVHKDDLFVGLLAPHPGGAAVWRYDGVKWEQVAASDRIAEWQSLTYVQTLHSDGDRLYAGVDNEVWLLADENWQRVANSDGTVPWSRKFNAYALTIYKGKLIVGLIGEGARVFRFAEGQWEDISTGLPSERSMGVYEIHVHTDGRLYAGTISLAGPARVYRFNDDGWTPVGGGGIQGSWVSPASNYPLSFTSYQDSLIVTLNRNPQVNGAFVSVWALQDDGWHPVGRDSVPFLWGQTDNFNASIVYGDRLYVGGGGRPAGNASIWEYSAERRWVQVGGRGVHGSWSPNRERMSGSRHATAEYVYRLVEWRGQLIAGFGDAPGAAQIWAYRPHPGSD